MTYAHRDILTPDFFNARTVRRVPLAFIGVFVLLSAALSVITPTQASGQSGGVCSRTPQVRDAIMRAAGAADCNGVTSGELAAITHLDFLGDTITALKSGDFAGLTWLRWLNLDNNSLSSLPAGVFEGLTELGPRTLSLQGNPGSPFRLSLGLERVDGPLGGGGSGDAQGDGFARGRPGIWWCH